MFVGKRSKYRSGVPYTSILINRSNKLVVWVDQMSLKIYNLLTYFNIHNIGYTASLTWANAAGFTVYLTHYLKNRKTL